MKRTAFVFLLVGCFALVQHSNADNPELTKAIEQIAEGNYAAAITILLPHMGESPTEPAYYYLGSAYWHAEEAEKAAATFEDGASKFPLSARIHNAAAKVYEQKFDLGKAIGFYRRAIALDPLIAYTGGGRYDPEFGAIYIPVVHDHRGKNSCGGRLYVDDEKMHFVVYYVASDWGLGKDDSFVLPFSNLEYVEVDRKKGQQIYDYSIETLLTNLSGPRRRIATGEESRVDLKFVAGTYIKGYRGKPWTKKNIKFFFIEPEIGEAFFEFLESKGVQTILRKKEGKRGS